MKKIIKGAFTKFIADCAKCGCKFEYDLEDVDIIDENGLEVKCPHCDFYTSHHSDEGLASSRVEIETDIKTDKAKVVSGGYCHNCGREVAQRLEMEIPYVDKRYLCKRCYYERGGML